MSMSLSFAQSLDEKKEIIKNACQTLEKSIKETYQGSGTAKVLIHREALPPAEIRVDRETGEEKIIKPRGTKIETTEEKFLVDFAFKGEKSLAERYEINENGEKRRLLSSTINTPEISFHYNGEENHAVRAPTESFRSFYRELGYDFHPEVSIQITGKSFWEMMGLFLKYEKVVNMNSDTKDVFRIEFGDKINGEAPVIFVLNPQANFRPVEYSLKGEILGNNNKKIGEDTFCYQANWKQYSPNYWYIKDLKYERLVKWEEKLPTKYRVEIEVLSFDPETKVEDSKFNFENLNIPGGIPVNDLIEKTDYKWGLK